MKKYNFELNIMKCQFLQSKIEYLGYTVSQDGITMSDRHTRAIFDFPIPKNIRQLQGFLGLTNYFRRFIRNYALKVKPLQCLTRKSVDFVFNENCRQAFESLKKELTVYPVLRLYNPTAETEVHTDASGSGFGAILLQRQADGTMAAVAYFSKATSDTEKKYYSYELETIVKALERFHIYLQGIPFKVVTDCNSLVLALRKIEINPRIARWSLAFQNYNFETVHRSGEKMPHVDALSRYVYAIDRLTIEDELMFKQLSDKDLKKLAESIEMKGNKNFTLINGIIFRIYNERTLFVVPETMIGNIIRIYHDEMGHVGVEKTAKGILGHYWFPCLKQKVREHINNCVTCLQFSLSNNHLEGELQIIDKGTRPFETLHIDHFGPLETSKGYKHILIIIDAFTKYVWLMPTKTTNTREVEKCLLSLFNIFGFPQRIVSDRGSCFTSQDFDDLISRLKIKHVQVAVASPWANGQVERANRFLKSTLAKTTHDANEWQNKLNDVQYILNNTYHKSVNTSPSKLLLGYDQRNVIEI